MDIRDIGCMYVFIFEEQKDPHPVISALWPTL